jgi:hypothetical protein
MTGKVDFLLYGSHYRTRTWAPPAACRRGSGALGGEDRADAAPGAAQFHALVEQPVAGGPASRRDRLDEVGRRGAAGKTGADDDDVEAVLLGSLGKEVARRSRTGDGNVEMRIRHSGTSIV